MDDHDSWPLKQLVEGIHYYLEDGLMVLTERYHLARGIVVAMAVAIVPMIM